MKNKKRADNLRKILKTKHHDFCFLNIYSARDIHTRNLKVATDSSVACLICLPTPCQSWSIVGMSVVQDRIIRQMK